MKKRVIALLLCAVMLVTCMGVGIFAPPDIKLVDAESGEAVSAIAIPQSERVKIATDYESTNEIGYQWQLSPDGKAWFNIYGQTGESIQLSYAMVCNMLSDEGTAQVRCVVTDGDSEYASREAEVSVDYSAPAQSPKQAAPAKASAVQNDAAPQADETGTSVITINYVYQSGAQAANPWTATIPEGETLVQTVESPSVVGYEPDRQSVEVDSSGQTNYTVTYYPADVNFTVKHYLQNISNDDYTLDKTENKTGKTESAVGGSLAGTYTGFTALLYDTETKVAADGSTVVEIYYDRNYYLLSLDLDGGYGAEPMYARYGTDINIADPTKAGYTFAGWKNAVTGEIAKLPLTIQADKMVYKAIWAEDTSGFNVVFWYENANDSGYSVIATYKPADVKTGSTVSSDDYKDYSFKGRDNDHFTYNLEKAETITVEGDGSAVLNVYYTRNKYTITFPGVQNPDGSYTCGKVEHEHAPDVCCDISKHTIVHRHTGYGTFGTCNTDLCPYGYEHKHTSSCYSYAITVKYDADITYVWDNDPIKRLLSQGYVFQSNITDKFYSFLEKMPGQDITMTMTKWSGDTYEWYYYLEVPTGMSAPSGAQTRQNGGRTYYLYHTTTIKGEDVTLTYEEDYFPITGYKQQSSEVPSFSWDKSSKKYIADLYYTREQYDLTFINKGAAVKAETKYYQADLDIAEYRDFIPPYPDSLERGGYEFAGWCADAFCQNSFEFAGATMPAGPLVLYAKWTPKTHTVKTWLTDNMDTPVNVGDSNVQNILHREKASKPATPTNGNYTFVGWFYMENGVEKAFDFSMPVTKDLDLYAKWSSNTLVQYTIKYTLEDGTVIAPPTNGSALAGTTKTFNAKSGNDLNEGYRTGYFPKTSSHSVTMDINGGNEYTFVYVERAKVNYTVKYLEKGTGNVLAKEESVTTSDAVITEQFKPVKGYAPDAYQKKLVLSADDEANVIIFWYTKDEVHAPVQIIHWIQNVSGNDYTEYQSSTNLNAIIGNEYTANQLVLKGFEFNEERSNSKGTLDAKGLVLNMYYDRIAYAYEFQFREQGGNKQLADPESGKELYEARVSESAKDIPGYELVSAPSQTIAIAIEDPADTAKNNVKVFYYKEKTVDIKYEIVGPADCGSLTKYVENVNAINGSPEGSTAIVANNTYKFVGWYLDKDCTKPVSASWVSGDKITPAKSKDYGSDTMGYEAATYYAKFEYNLTSMTLSKEVTGGAYDANDMFIFTITDSSGHVFAKVTVTAGQEVTISGLTVGEEYTITEDNNWSWRYTDKDPIQFTMTADPNQNVVEVTNTIKTNQWLGASSYAINQCVEGITSKIDAFFAKLFG